MHCLTCPVMRFHYTALNAHSSNSSHTAETMEPRPQCRCVRASLGGSQKGLGWRATLIAGTHRLPGPPAATEGGATVLATSAGIITQARKVCIL